MHVSPAQFDTLLSAINLGDGTKFRTIKYQSGTNVITSGNKEFCDRLQILGVRCGYRSAIFTAPGWEGGVKYRVTLSKKAFVNIGGKTGDRSEWEFDQGTPGEKVWCVENRLGTLVTRRNGKVAIVGNCQGLYRATRVLPGIVSDDMTAEQRRSAIAASAKPHSLIISPFFISDRIDICSVHDLFVDRNEFGESTKRMAGDMTDPVKIRDFIAALRAAANKHAHKQARTIDPVKFSLSIGDTALANYTPETQADAAPASKAELDFLLEKGISTVDIRNSGQAQKLIARFMERERLGLASPRQLMQLLLLGFPEESAVLMKKGLAGVIMGKRIRYKRPI